MTYATGSTVRRVVFELRFPNGAFCARIATLREARARAQEWNRRERPEGSVTVWRVVEESGERRSYVARDHGQRRIIEERLVSA